jgi:hypothetical protein
MILSKLATRRSVLVAALLSAVLCDGSADADIIELASGGRLDGKVVPSEDDKSQFTIDLAAGGRLTIPRSQVARIDTISETEAEYEQLAHASPDTVDAHWKMAEWCRQHKLTSDYQHHLERILELDPNHADARAALGFRQKDGQWLNRDDVMAARGLVMFEGRYVTPQHVEILTRQKESKETQADWKHRIDQLRRALTGRSQDRASQAEAELRAITDPAAAEAVVNLLQRENDPALKRFWIEIASHLDHRAAIDALVDLSLTDPDDDIRQLCLETLIKSGRNGLSTPYIRALNNRDNEIVNRAGTALGRIRDRDSIGPLIDALMTKHRVKVGPNKNPDQHAYTFEKDSNAFSFGGGGGPQMVTQSFRNRAVLDALLVFSGGTNFEYDQEQWRGWLAAQSKATAVDVRRDQ